MISVNDPVETERPSPGIFAAAALLAGCADKRGGPILTRLGHPAPDAPTLAQSRAIIRLRPRHDTVQGLQEATVGDYEIDLTGQCRCR